MSDININPGSSGGPLFNGAGQVIGLTTFGTHGEGGPGVSGIVRIEEALALLEQNRAKAAGTLPPGALLPVEPLTPYPSKGSRKRCGRKKYDWRPYYFAAGDFNIALSTPPLDYREQEERRLQAEREHKKRNRNNKAPTRTRAIPVSRRSGKRKPERIQQYSEYMRCRRPRKGWDRRWAARSA